MASKDFVFALEFSTQGVPAELLEDLAGHVLRHVGCSEDAKPALMAAIEKAAASGGAGARRCDVMFRVRQGTLEILVSSNGGRVWQTEIAVP